MTAVAVGLAQRGQLTIPKSLRDRYGLKDAHADAVRDGLLASGAALEEMLADLRERREVDEA